MTWLRAHVTRDGVVTTTDAWLVHRLTGAFVTDAATASRTALLDLDRTAWSADACACFGIDATELPAIVGCAEPVGETPCSARACRSPGSPSTSRRRSSRRAVSRPATPSAPTGRARSCSRRRGRARGGRRPGSSRAWRGGSATPRRIASTGRSTRPARRCSGSSASGSSRRRPRSTRSRSRCRRPPASRSCPRSPASPRRSGSRRRGGRSSASALATERGHLVRAVLEGIAAQVALLAAAVEADLGAALGCLRVDGGLARSRVLLQAQADLAQRRVEVYPSPDATASGVAALARLGVGAATTAEDAVALVAVGGLRAAHRRGGGGRALGALAPRGGGRDGSLRRVLRARAAAAEISIVATTVRGRYRASPLRQRGHDVPMPDLRKDMHVVRRTESRPRRPRDARDARWHGPGVDHRHHRQVPRGADQDRRQGRRRDDRLLRESRVQRVCPSTASA